MHNTHTIRSGMVPGVQKVGVVHSIDQGPAKSESEGAFYNYLCGGGASQQRDAGNAGCIGGS